MKFDMQKIVGVLVGDTVFNVEPGTMQIRPVLDGQPQPDMTAVRLKDSGEWLVVKDGRADALIFYEEEVVH